VEYRIVDRLAPSCEEWRFCFVFVSVYECLRLVMSVLELAGMTFFMSIQV
jgi:hypothetical protein